MTVVDDLEVLSRAHGLFAGRPQTLGIDASAAHDARLPAHSGAAAAAYRDAAGVRTAQLTAAMYTDTELSGIVAQARRDHGDAQRHTAAVLAAARSDAMAISDNPIAHRELLRRRVARLRAQHAHVLTARRRARRRLAALRALRYRLHRRRLVQVVQERGGAREALVADQLLGKQRALAAKHRVALVRHVSELVVDRHCRDY